MYTEKLSPSPESPAMKPKERFTPPVRHSPSPKSPATKETTPQIPALERPTMPQVLRNVINECDGERGGVANEENSNLETVCPVFPRIITARLTKVLFLFTLE